ncbi:MAG: recombinase RecT [Thiotrichales bacterium]|nr:recombinase RecT [Thiotrichales bacterium]
MYKNHQVANMDYVLNAPQERQKMIAALPAHIKPEKFMQIAATAAMLNPQLQECTPASLMTALIQCAKDGLVPDNRESAIVAYNKKQGSEWVSVAQYQPMIDGVLKRLRMSSEVPYVAAKPVYDGDHFNYWMDMEGEKFEYKPQFDTTMRGDLKLVFAVAKLKTGEMVLEWMSKEDVDKIMYMSKSAVDSKTGALKQNSVWVQHYERMALKTVLHRIARRLPNSSEVMEMIEREVQIKDIRNGRIVDDVPVVDTPKTISTEKQQELESLVNSTASDAMRMFGWVSSSTNRIVNSFSELDEQQYSLLKNQLETKLQKLTMQASMAQASQAVMEGELVNG